MANLSARRWAQSDDLDDRDALARADRPFTSEAPIAPLKHYPSGPLTFVTENDFIGAKLRAATDSIGLVHTFYSGSLTVDLPAALADLAFHTLDEHLSDDEHEQVFVFLEPNQGPRLLSLRRLLGLCRDAWFIDFLESGIFRSHLQPIVDLRKGIAFGFEALLRAERADGVAVPPLEALRAARATGRLAEFDARARESALRAGASRLAPGDRLFINIDPDSVLGGMADFESTLALARALPQPPSHIIFELIETEGVARSTTLAALLTEVRAEGFRIALDDLESGFSTLGVLERLRPDIAKLDQHLVRGAYADPYRARLVQAFVSLTRDLGIQLIVEGVETREDYGFVCDLGIRLAQGYYFGRPAFEPMRSFPLLPTNVW